MECVVLEIEPPRRMVWSWQSSESSEPTRVEFRLDPIEGGTRLTLMHTGDTDPASRDRLSSGWPVKLSGLRSLLTRAG
jgi:uncharacterized protein YndB with AHSA1/START domain